MHKDHAIFISSLEEKRKVMVEFYSKEDGRILIRKCAPMDFGPSRREKIRVDQYHVWDYESDKKMHTLALKNSQIVSITPTDEFFDPGEFITWSLLKSPWFYKRNWENYS